MYRFQDLYVTLPPKDGWLAQVDVDPLHPWPSLWFSRASGFRSRPQPLVATRARAIPSFRSWPPQDGVDPLWNYLTTGLAGAYFATDYFQEAGDLQSVAEAEGLESKLTAAITKVRDRKAQLQAREERMTL